MKRLIENHPLGAVLLAAALLRLLAVVFSKGYMASDDHFETVAVAYDWLQNGFWGPDGLMHWKGRPAHKLSRFPLYTPVLYLNMKLAVVLTGQQSLDSIMYVVRATHALFSLLGVWAVYAVTRRVTLSVSWAAAAGLTVAAHFALPFLSVRNLIEMVGGLVWIISLWAYYRWRDDHHDRWLIVSALLAVVAWMCRFQMIFAIAFVPPAVWFGNRRVRPAVVYSLAVVAGLLAAGIVEWILVGQPFGTTLAHIRQGLTEGAVYRTSMFVYLGVIAGFFIPPLALLILYASARRSFWSQHRVLVFSTAGFVVVHSLMASRQERYMIPMVPVLCLIAVLALRQYIVDNGWLVRKQGLFKAVVASSLAINFVLLPLFTFNYGHRGMVEPLVTIESLGDTRPAVLFFTPDRYRNFPIQYGGFEPIVRQYVWEWKELQPRLTDPAAPIRYDFVLLYPPDSTQLSVYLDSLRPFLGELEPAFYERPSLMDLVLHKLNPRHNRTNDVWVYRPVSADGRKGSAEPESR